MAIAVSGCRLSGGHRKRHASYKSRVLEVITSCRDRLGIESVWSIEVQVQCPSCLPHEAAIQWDSEAFYARLALRCSVPARLVTWLVYHEMCELQQWRTGSFVRSLLSAFPALSGEAQQALTHFQQVRNQEIECRVYGLLGMRRPAHLVVSSEDPEERPLPVLSPASQTPEDASEESDEDDIWLSSLMAPIQVPIPFRGTPPPRDSMKKKGSSYD